MDIYLTLVSIDDCTRKHEIYANLNQRVYTPNILTL
jgi:hypothetical protein